MSDEISTEELLSMRVVPEQQADLAAVQDALGGPPTAEQIVDRIYQRNLLRAVGQSRGCTCPPELPATYDGPQPVCAIHPAELGEAHAEIDRLTTELDQAKNNLARSIVRYSQDPLLQRIMDTEAERDEAERVAQNMRVELGLAYAQRDEARRELDRRMALTGTVPGEQPGDRELVGEHGVTPESKPYRWWHFWSWKRGFHTGWTAREDHPFASPEASAAQIEAACVAYWGRIGRPYINEDELWHIMRDALRAAAAVSGEQAQPDGEPR